MRRLFIRTLLAAGLALTIAGPTSGANADVTIKGFAFTPATITVAAGGSVTWTNEDSAGHTATAEDGSFGTGLIMPTASASVTFTTPGTFRYYCSPHRSMLGTVVVVPAAPATDSEPPASAATRTGPPEALLLALAAALLTILAFRVRSIRRA